MRFWNEIGLCFWAQGGPLNHEHLCSPIVGWRTLIRIWFVLLNFYKLIFEWVFYKTCPLPFKFHVLFQYPPFQYGLIVHVFVFIPFSWCTYANFCLTIFVYHGPHIIKNSTNSSTSCQKDFKVFSKRNLVLCNHSICNYMHLIVICIYVLSLLQLFIIFSIYSYYCDYNVTNLWLLNFPSFHVD